MYRMNNRGPKIMIELLGKPHLMVCIGEQV